MSDELKALKHATGWDGDLIPCVDCGEEMATRSVRGAPMCRICHAAAYERALEARIEALQAERDALVKAGDELANMLEYGKYSMSAVDHWDAIRARSNKEPEQ